MANALSYLLSLFNLSCAPVVQFEHLVHFEDWESYVQADWLIPTRPAAFLTCRNCLEQPDLPVHLLKDQKTHSIHAYLSCYECGMYEVPREHLQCWELRVDPLLSAIGQSLAPREAWTNIASGDLWRLGPRRRRGPRWNTFFACGFPRSGVWETLRQADLPARSVVFIPARPIQFPENTDPLLIIPLNKVLSWENQTLRLNRERIEPLLEDWAACAGPPKISRRPKDGLLRSRIERLRRELDEHLRAARDYARDSERRTGCPELLPRPSQEYLAKRCCVSKSTISRNLKSDPVLSQLWESCLDLYQVLNYQSLFR